MKPKVGLMKNRKENRNKTESKCYSLLKLGKAVAGQENTAVRMTRRAKHLSSTLQLDDNATLKVPEFDRRPCNSRNLLVVVMQRDNDLYRLAAENVV